MTFDQATIRENVARVLDRIAAAGGDPEVVRVLAVTKGFPASVAAAAYDAGLARLGENYAQELVEKAAAVPEAEWHFIGGLQSNKVRLVADLVSCWQSVDRVSLVAEIAKRSPGARILVQVNATGEASKAGCRPEVAPDLVGAARDAGLDVAGLMAIGVDGDERATTTAFERTAAIADELHLPERSMGMSADLELAIRAGSTLVRIGSALFGPRPPDGSP